MSIFGPVLGGLFLMAVHIGCIRIDRKRGTCAWRVTYLALMAGVLLLAGLTAALSDGWGLVRAVLYVAVAAWFAYGATTTAQRHARLAGGAR